MFIRLTILIALMSLVAGAALAATPSAKSVAAPPEEIALGHLRLPDPAQAAIRSQTALIPINLSQRQLGLWTAEIDFPVESTASLLSLVLIAPERERWDITIRTADGQTLPWREAASRTGIEHHIGNLGLGERRFPAESLNFTAPAGGNWTVHIRAPRGGRGGAPIDGYLAVASDSQYGLASHLADYELYRDSPVGIVAYAYDRRQDGETPLTAVVDSARLRLFTPDGAMQMVAMADDGLNGDETADDGRFMARFIPDHMGEYRAQVLIEGTTLDGEPFHRTAEHVFPVIRATLDMTGDGRLIIGENNRLTVELDVEEFDTLSSEPRYLDGGAIRLSAELWGTGQDGQAVPVAWVGGMVEAEAEGARDILRLEVDRRWIDRARADEPFSLRAARIHDRDTQLPLAQNEQIMLALSQPLPPHSAAAPPVTDDMLTGRRPAAAQPTQGISTTATTDPRLMLVHGYCSSSDPWPTADFTGFAVFSDLNQNRSNDQFARLIGNFGAQFGSFGIVAHSQGGNASLHLYTYYWSGLDFSTGSRLIQSVGSPYRGTALAGSLALIGDIFGVGCGTNWDLTYDGAALWLSGIPDWARQRVYYSTTSFEDVWWRYDYCSLASDLFLDDPEDGVVERWAGQLAGANNMGHKTGWCHTTGMRDPAQYLDSARNQNMNLYANR